MTPISFSNHFPMLQQHFLFMQGPKNSHKRKPWYQRAFEAANLWLPISKPSAIAENTDQQKLKKSTSVKVAISFTRVCLCAPISSYTEVFKADLPPRRSCSTYTRSRSFIASHRPERLPAPAPAPAARSPRHSIERRRVFRGKSLTDDMLMRRFMVEESVMHTRRRNQMEVIRRRHMKRRKLGPSPLSRMVMADQEA